MKELPRIASAQSWKQEMAASIVSADGLARVLPVEQGAVNRVSQVYPMRITPYFLSLIKDQDDPLGRQVIPREAELGQPAMEDPLCEETQSPTPGLIHRYPAHVLFMVESRCAVYCRHCMRKRRVGKGAGATREAIGQGLDYIRRTPRIREVVLSGGDPLVKDDGALFAILEALRTIPHVEVIRMHTRIPGALPSRVTPELARGLADFHPLYVNIQFNHPAEITPQSEQACRLLADHGVPLGSQTVLLAGVNDDPEILKKLMEGLLRIRVRPYYLHQLDRVRGACHFHAPVARGLELMETLRQKLSGMALPKYVVDLPGGKGKAPLPGSIVGEKDGMFMIRNFAGEVIPYQG